MLHFVVINIISSAVKSSVSAALSRRKVFEVKRTEHSIMCLCIGLKKKNAIL